MLIWDTPYGIGVADWDVRITSDDLVTILQQFSAINSNDHHTVAFWVDWRDAGRYNDVLVAQGYRAPFKFTWYKNDQNVVGDPANITLACEMLIIAQKKSSGSGSLPNYMSANPLERHNIICGPGLHKYHMHPDGHKVNCCQKPPYVMEKICRMYTRPGDNVVVIGSGAGGEVFGALQARCQVVAIDNDARQVDWMGGHLATFDAAEDQRVERDDRRQARAAAQQANAPPSGGGASAPNMRECLGCGLEHNNEDMYLCAACGNPVCNDCRSSSLHGIACSSGCAKALDDAAAKAGFGPK